jgi:hypothetical protein
MSKVTNNSILGCPEDGIEKRLRKLAPAGYKKLFNFA